MSEREEQPNEEKNEQIKEMGSLELTNSKKKHNIRLLTIIGEIEGHEAVNANTKATKYEHYFQNLLRLKMMKKLRGF